MNKTRFFVGDRVITVETSVKDEPRIVDWDDIEGSLEGDDWSGETPWEHCDGWEHEFEGTGYWDHADAADSYTYVNRRVRDGGCGYIVIDDSQLYDGPSGCSKQVRFEAIAQSRRKATEQLVKWYCDGWHVYCAVAKYGDYTDSLGGIYDDAYGEYASEYVDECRNNVADQLEDDGYTVENRPDPPKPYNRVDAFKDSIRRNLDCS